MPCIRRSYAGRICGVCSRGHFPSHAVLYRPSRAVEYRCALNLVPRKKKLLCEGHEIQEPPPIKQNMGIRTMGKTKVPCGQAISQQKILVNEWPKPRHFLIQWLATETKDDKKKEDC